MFSWEPRKNLRDLSSSVDFILLCTNCNFQHRCKVMEFVDGVSLEHLGAKAKEVLSGEEGSNRLRELGGDLTMILVRKDLTFGSQGIIAFDILVNNWDRFPL